MLARSVIVSGMILPLTLVVGMIVLAVRMPIMGIGQLIV
jgi:hypothetical protein